MRIDVPEMFPFPFHRLPYDRFFLLLFFLLGIMVISIYHPALVSGLQSDDWFLSSSTPKLGEIFTGHWIGGGPGSFYRPISRMIIRMEGWLFGYNGFAQHLISLGLFLFSAFLIARKIQKVKGDFAALLAAGYILLNPIATETVSWVSSQTDLICQLFLLLSFYYLLDSLEKIRRRNFILSMVFAVLAYLSKETASIMGPVSVVILFCYIASYGWEKVKAQKLLMFTVCGHVILFIAYMLLRLVFLKKILSVEEALVEDTCWHKLMVVLNVLSEYISPFVVWFKEKKDIVDNRSSLWWFGIILSIFAGTLVHKRRIITLGLLLSFLASLYPIFVIRNPDTYTNLIHAKRFLFNSLFIASPLLVYILFDAVGEETVHKKSLLLISIFLLLGVNLSFQTLKNTTSWKRAADLRDSIGREISAIAETGSMKKYFVVISLPDHVDEAFVFRNGFDIYMDLLWKDKNIQVISDKDLTVSSIDPRTEYFKLEYIDENTPLIKPYHELKPLMEYLRKGVSPAKKVNLLYDFSKPLPNNFEAYPSPDIKVLNLQNNRLVCVINGMDPYLLMRFSQDAQSYAYRKGVLTFEFAEPVQPRDKKEDLFQLIWKPAGSTSTTLPSVDRNISLTNRKQTVVFPLDNNIRWMGNPRVEWFRFDLGWRYQGKVYIYVIGIE